MAFSPHELEEFLWERRNIALPDLRAELRQQLAKLKEELVKLINDDYEAFISLSADLRDEGARLERLRRPLETLKTNVLVCSFFATRTGLAHFHWYRSLRTI